MLYQLIAECTDYDFKQALEVKKPKSRLKSVSTSERRNPVLADIFARMKFMERRGSGLKKITDNTNALFNDGENHVEFFSDGNYFKVTIHNALHGKRIGDKSNVTDVTKTDMEEAIIEQIKLNPKVTVDQLAEKLQVNRITLMKQKGTIKRVGSSRNGYWVI